MPILCLTYTLAKVSAQAPSPRYFEEQYAPYFADMNLSAGILLHRDGVTHTVGLNLPADKTVFNIGSGTKTFTAVLILQEVEKGNLRLSDSIGNFLSPIPNIDGSASIESLLRHTTGFAEIVGDQDWNAYDDPDDRLFRQDLFASVGARDSSMIGSFQYTNTNYILLGEILEKVNDRSYFELLRERIFEPCQMEDSYPYVSRTIPKLVHPTDLNTFQDVYDGINYKFFAHYAFAAGSIASTLRDMARFYTLLFETDRLITPGSLRLMLDFKDDDYGLGVERTVIDGVPYIGHGGNNAGYAFRTFYDPRNGNLAMVFCNRLRLVLREALIQDMMHYLNDLPPARDFSRIPPAEFSTYQGTYRLRGAGVNFDITPSEEVLYLVFGDYKSPLVGLEPRVLYDGTSGILLRLDPSQPERLTFVQAGSEMVADRL
ncbi:serine hydrolase domain-containing protein [Lewinella sp. IMCC34191]|uniref:serine hydrolase domain-containing protein n=1 Tax=Lewinella sp. IMCC34191 TaxID=2259172 RepID=UPI001300BA76|nr:serine hydrolase domain-containing protein [Lewinella sp. IMCC34191]